MHQVALVAEQRKKSGLAAGILFHFSQHGRRFLSNRRPRGIGQGSPGCPAEAHHLVEHAIALSSQRHLRDLSGAGLWMNGRS